VVWEKLFYPGEIFPKDLNFFLGIIQLFRRKTTKAGRRTRPLPASISLLYYAMKKLH
jgi:hypothetical protein